MRKILFLSVFSILVLFSNAQIQWQKSLGGTSDDEAFSIQQTSDGGYIVAGYSSSSDGDVTGHHEEYNCWVVKLSSNVSGIISPNKDDINISMYPNPASIQVRLISSELRDVMLFNALGNLVWHQKYSGDKQAVIPVKDYAPGIYTVKVHTNKGTTTRKLLVK